MFQNNLLMGAAAATSGGTSVVSVGNSALFTGTNYLARTPSATGVEEKGTLSRWIYRDTLAHQCSVFAAYISSTQLFQIYFPADNTLHAYNYSGGYDWQLATTQVFRDIGWYHIVVAIDTTQAVVSDRVIIYINGERVTALATASYPSLNFVNDFNTASVPNYFGTYDGAGGNGGLKGYASETVWIDGLQLAPTSFGAYDSSGLFWTPLSSDTIKELTFGTNGFYLANDQGGAQFDSRYSNPTTYVPNSVNFDGTNDTLQRGADLTGNADTKNAIISFWIRRNGGAGSKQTILNNLNGLLETYIGTDNKIHLEATGGGSKRCDINTTATILVDGSWHHVMMSFNGTSQHVYVDGVSSKTSTTNVDATIDWTMDNWYMGASQTPSYYLNADVADLIFDNTYLDLSQSSNRALFINTDGDPVDPGSDGSTAIVAGSPLIVFNKALASWHTNAGTGEGFTEVGALTAGSTVRSAFANDFINNNTVTTNTHTPTNISALLNPLMSGSTGTFSSGNRTATLPPVNTSVISSLAIPSTGKWYCEVRFATIHGYAVIGVGQMDASSWLVGGASYISAGPQFTEEGTLFTQGTTSGDAITVTTDTTYGAMWDADNSILKITDGTNTYQCAYTVNDTSVPLGFQFAISSGSVTGNVSVNFGDPPFAISSGNADGNDQGNFEFAPPSGYLALNTANLASETTRTASNTNKYFDTILYEGNGQGQRVGQFQPFGDSFTVAKSGLWGASGADLTRGSMSGTTTTWTFSAWVKRTEPATGGTTANFIFTTASDAGLSFGNNSTADLISWYSGSYTSSTTAVVDQSQWFHFVLKNDGGTGTGYLNGVEVLSSLTVNTADATMAVGSYNGASNELDGYMAEVVFIDGSALAPTSFAKTDTSTNRWVPIDVSGLTYNGNSFYLNFADSSDLGNDVSGNNKDFTNNSGVTSSNDSPTSNFAILDGNNCYASPVASSGNLVADGYAPASSNTTGLGVQTGKWYWELTMGSTIGTPALGIVPEDEINKAEYPGQSANSFGWYDTAIYRNNGSYLASYFGASPTNGQVQSIALDLDSNPQTVTFRKANTAGAAIPIPPNKVWHPTLRNGAAADASNVTLNFGASDFTYTPPTGFVALKQDNIASSDQFISAFSWIKNRDATDNHMLFDRVRGPFKDIHSNDMVDEVTNVNTLQQFLAGGAQVGNDVEVNTANESYVLWDWMMEATGTGSSNTDGTINTTSTLVDTTLGMSISTYVGTGSNATIGHGLGVKPGLILLKVLNIGGSAEWIVYHQALTTGSALFLNSSVAQAASTGYFNNTQPTSSVFTVGNSTYNNSSGDNHVAYCFSDSQFISIGSYEGNGNANGTFVSTVNSLGVPIQPVWIIAKNMDASASWTLWDIKRNPYNVGSKYFYPDTNNSEQTADAIDIDTGGFKWRNSNVLVNASNTYIYMAIGTPIIDTDGRIIAGR